MKHPWGQDLEADEDDPYIDAVLTGLLVIVVSIACTTFIAFVLGFLWPHIERWM